MNKGKIYLVHGFNVKDGGEGTLGALRPVLEGLGYEVVMVRYGWVFRLRVRLCNSRLARVIGSMAEQRSIAIGHSNGCELIHEALSYGAPFKKVLYFNPALDNDVDMSPQVDQFYVFYSDSDSATKWAKYIPFDPWGNMGNVGYKGTSTNVTNFNLEDITGREMSHSSFAEYPDELAPLLSMICEQEV